MKKNWYKGKVFIITGAGGDIGKEVCKLFAPLGMKIYLLDLPTMDLTSLKEELYQLGADYVENLPLDVINREQIKDTIDFIVRKEKVIDILFNNAGIGSKCSITNMGNFEEYRKIMSVNVDSMWMILQAALPYFGRLAPTKKYPNRKIGQLIFSSSSAGKTGVPYMAAYAMSKSAIIALANSIRLEFKMQNHKINVITSVSAPAKTKFYSTPEMIDWVKNYEKKGFLYKIVTPLDVAKRVLKASRKNKKEVFIPRWWKILDILFVLSHSLIGKLLIEIER